MLLGENWEARFGQEPQPLLISSILTQVHIGATCSTYFLKKLNFLEFGLIWMNMLTSVMAHVSLQPKLHLITQMIYLTILDLTQSNLILFLWIQRIMETKLKQMFMLLLLFYKLTQLICFWKVKGLDPSSLREARHWDQINMDSIGQETTMPTSNS